MPVTRARVLVVAALAGVALVLTPAVAHAEPDLGTLQLTPSAGTVEDALRMTTSAPCPPGADVSQARIYGPGFRQSGQNLSGIAPGFTSSKTPFSVESQYTLRDTAALTYPPVTYKGTYRITVICRTSKSDTLFGAFTTAITFKDAVNWVPASDPGTPVTGGPTTTPPPASTPKPTTSKPASSKPSASPATTGAAPASPGQTVGGAESPPGATEDATDDPSASTTDTASGSPVAPTPEATLAGDASQSSSSSAVGAALFGALGGAALVGLAVYLVSRRRSS